MIKHFKIKFTYKFLVITFFAVIVLFLQVDSLKIKAQESLVTEFQLESFSVPNYITAGSDRNMWYTNIWSGEIGRITPEGEITEFLIPGGGSPWDITAGPDGNVWFSDNAHQNKKIGKITPEGTITVFPLPARVDPWGTSHYTYGITSGPDGNVWFVQWIGDVIGKITPDGLLTEFSVPNNTNRSLHLWDITTGSDGNLWFTEEYGNNIGRITPDGVVTKFPIPTSNSSPRSITLGVDGNLWFTEHQANKIGRVTPNGQISEFPILANHSSPYDITTGPDGALWFTQQGTKKIGRMTTNGSVIGYELPPSTNAVAVSPGPDGNLWFTQGGADKIGRLNLSSLPTPSPTSTPSGSLNVPLLKQGIAPFNDNNPLWEVVEYDHGNSQSLWCGTTIAGCGCALTSIAMLLRYYNVVNPPDGGLTTPLTVNDYFNQRTQCGRGGCVSLGYAFGDVKWTTVNNYSADANRGYGTQKIIYDGGRGYNASVVSQDIDDGRPVILGVPNHWVIATGISGNTFSINDPLFSRTLLSDPAYNNTAVQGMRRFKKTNSDFSAIEVAAKSPSQIIITDPNGQKTGFDASTSTVVTNIPNSEYFFNEAFVNGTDELTPPPNSGVYWAIIQTPQAGDYQIEVVNPAGQGSSVAIYGADRDANTTFKLLEEEGNAENKVYSVDYNPEPGNIPLSLNVTVDVKPHGLLNLINPGSNGLVRVALLSDNNFDPLSVKPDTVRFGPEKAVAFDSYQTRDLNRDGRMDRIFNFRMNQTGIKKGDKEACLTGETTDGFEVKGCSKIRTPSILGLLISFIRVLND